jgi:hypothetical protein
LRAVVFRFAVLRAVVFRFAVLRAAGFFLAATFRFALTFVFTFVFFFITRFAIGLLAFWFYLSLNVRITRTIKKSCASSNILLTSKCILLVERE